MDSSSTAVSSRLIGLILVQKGLVTDEQLERALQIQSDTGERLGEVVVKEFGVARLELASVLAEQWAEFERVEREGDDVQPDGLPQGETPALAPTGLAADPPEPLIRRPIGEIFVESGFVTDEQLQAALDVQRETGARVGEILVEQGSMTRLDLASALADQWSSLQKLRPPEPAPAATPWQYAAPSTTPAPQSGPAPELPTGIADTLAELDARVRMVERAAAAAPGMEDLQLLSANLRTAVESIEQRSDDGETGALGTAIEQLREELNEPLRRIAELEAKVDEGTPTAGLEELQARVEEIASRSDVSDRVEALRGELQALAAGLEQTQETPVPAELERKLDAVAGQAEGAQAGIAALSQRIDELAALGGRIDEIASRVPGEDVVEELRARLAELSAKVEEHDGPDDVPLAALEELRARVEQIASRPDVSDRVEALREELGAQAGAGVPVEALEDLRARVAEIASRPDLGDRIEALRGELEAVAAVAGQAEGAQARIAALSDRVEELSALGGRIDELGSRGPAEEVVEELRGRLAELAAKVDAHDGPDDALPAALEELRARVEEIASRPDLGDRIEALRGELAGLAAKVDEHDRREDHAEFADLAARLDQLAGRVEDVASAPVTDPSEQLAEIAARLDELAASIPSARVDGLESRLDAFEEQNRSRIDPESVDRLAASLDEHRTAVDRRLAEVAARAADDAAITELRARLEELAVAFEANPFQELGERLSAIEERVLAGDPLTEIREEMRRAAESTAEERASIEQALMMRVEEITATVPREDELSALRDSLADLGSRVEHGDDALHARLIELATRLEQLADAGPAVEDLRASLTELGAARMQDSMASAARLAGIEASLEALAGIEQRVREAAARDAAEHRAERIDSVDEALRRLQSLTEIEARLEALADDLARRPDAEAVARTAEEIRQEARAAHDRLDGVVEDVAARARDEVRVVEEKFDGAVANVAARARDEVRVVQDTFAGVAADVTARIEEIEGRADSQVSRDELSSTIAEHAATVRLELETLRHASEERAGALEGRLSSFVDRDTADELRSRLDAAEEADAAHARAAQAARHDLTDRLDRSLGAIREDLDARDAHVDSRLDGQEAATAAIASQIEELHAAAAASRDEWQARIEALVQERIDSLGGRLTDQIAGVDARLDERTGALSVELSSLGMRVDEVLGLHHKDFQAARQAHETLTERVAGLQSLHEEAAGAATDAAAKLASRVDALAKRLRDQAAGAKDASEQVVARLGELEGLRADDAESAKIAGAELVARLDDLAVRSAAAAVEAERALRDEIGGVAARLEERDADGIEAREELRAELERVASSVGWRLERIEESLAADESAQLRASVAELEQRLEGQIAVGDEQVRVTERALRKGLASLGERLAENESSYVEAGNALRRSIERLGAAVVEADERIADREVDAPDQFDGQTAYVAFAPMEDGYRMVELQGEPPVVGGEVEVPGVEGLLVVTRVGTSPLPLDRRACAYLERQ